MSTNFQLLKEMKKRVLASNACVDSLISVTPEGWVHIKLNSLLPHCRVVSGTQFVRDSLLRLINEISFDGVKLPFFRKAFLGIIEFCPRDVSDVFDHDNKGFKAVQNVLKGRLFPDDDCFELSLGLFTELRNESCCHIYVLPDDEAGIFTDMRLSHDLGSAVALKKRLFFECFENILTAQPSDPLFIRVCDRFLRAFF